MGHWSNFEELEENLSLPEIQQILDSSRKVEKSKQRFVAALKGIDIDKGGEGETDFDAVKRRAEARLRGISEEQLELADIGVTIIDEDVEVK